MTEGVFKISEKRPIRDEMTISRSAGLSSHNPVTWFSMGAKTSISQESYDNTILYLGEEGVSTFLLGNPAQKAFFKQGRFSPCSCQHSLRRRNRGGFHLYRNYFRKGEFYEQHCKIR